VEKLIVEDVEWGQPIEVRIGNDNIVEIYKWLGATAAEKVRIRFDLPNCEWVVERLRDFPCKGHTFETVELEHKQLCKESIWEEKIRWHAQETFEEFENEQDK
jgi:hypothetical protein